MDGNNYNYLNLLAEFFIYKILCQQKPTWRLGVGCMEAWEIDESIRCQEEVWDDRSDGVEITCEDKIKNLKQIGIQLRFFHNMTTVNSAISIFVNISIRF